jgi:hypothetical protein
MKQLALLVTLALLAAACGLAALTPTALPTVPFTPTTLPPTALPPTPTPPPPEPTIVLTPVPSIQSLLPTVGPNVLASVTTFADLPGNVATGAPAPDFTARLPGGDTFTLSKQRGSSVLLFPTIVGCGDCIFSLQEMTGAYPDYRGRGLKVVILNLYPEDTPETWQPFADYFAEPEFIWGVVSSTGFVVDYNLISSGTTLLVDPEGNLVFRSDYPLVADGFRQLFELAAR